MKNQEPNYIAVFISIFVAYTIAQFPIAIYKPELIRYVILFQIPFFIVPIVFIHYYYDNTARSFASLKNTYKLHLNFDIAYIPTVL
jgi:hypothetical protein